MDIDTVQNVQAALSSFGVSAVEISSLSGGTANRNFKVTSGDEIYVLRKKNPKYCIENYILFEWEFLTHLAKRNIPAPEFLCSVSDGKPYVRSDDGVYQMYRMLTGGAMDRDSETQIYEAGTFLARFQNAAEGFKSSVEKIQPRRDAPDVLTPMIDKAKAEHYAAMTVQEREIFDYICGIIDEIFCRLSPVLYDSLPKTVMHGDFHPANVLYSDDKISGIFDFDWASIQPRIFDVSDGICFFSSYREKPVNGGDIFSLTGDYMFTIPRMKIFLEGYTSSVSTPLSDEEKKYLPDFMLLRVISSRIQALSKIPPESHIKMLTNWVAKPSSWIENNRNAII